MDSGASGCTTGNYGHSCQGTSLSAPLQFVRGVPDVTDHEVSFGTLDFR